MGSQFVDEMGHSWHLFFETLTLSDAQHQFSGLVVLIRKARNAIPMVEEVLRESLTLGVLSEYTREAETLCNG